MALIDRIADLPGIETVECNDETIPRRVKIYLSHQPSIRPLKQKPATMLCSLDRNGVFLNGLDRWERYQVLSTGWGKLVERDVCVCLPRDTGELEVVWRIVQQAYDRLTEPMIPEAGSLVISTWDRPRFSRTSLQ